MENEWEFQLKICWNATESKTLLINKTWGDGRLCNRRVGVDDLCIFKFHSIASWQRAWRGVSNTCVREWTSKAKKYQLISSFVRTSLLSSPARQGWHMDNSLPLWIEIGYLHHPFIILFWTLSTLSFFSFVPCLCNNFISAVLPTLSISMCNSALRPLNVLLSVSLHIDAAH